MSILVDRAGGVDILLTKTVYHFKGITDKRNYEGPYDVKEFRPCLGGPRIRASVNGEYGFWADTCAFELSEDILDSAKSNPAKYRIIPVRV